MACLAQIRGKGTSAAQGDRMKTNASCQWVVVQGEACDLTLGDFILLRDGTWMRLADLLSANPLVWFFDSAEGALAARLTWPPAVLLRSVEVQGGAA
jgi:hypothetical protein